MSLFRSPRARAPSLFLLTLAGLLLAHVAAIAAPVEPPLDLLLSDQSRLVSGKVTEINPAGRVVFERAHVFSDYTDVPEMIDVRVSPSVLESVAIGEQHVFAYSMTHRDKLAPAGVSLNRDGAILVSSSGIEPALFADTPALRSILKAAASEHGRASRGLLDLLVKALAGEDAAVRALAAGQIALDPAMSGMLNAKDRKIVERLARNPDAPPATRSLLLLAAAERPGEFGKWWREAAEEVLASTPLDGYPSGTMDPTSLVLLAFDVFDIREVLAPRDSLARWLRSPNRLLLERSNAALGRGFPAWQRQAIGEALADPSLNRESRKYLDDQLRRLDPEQSGKATQ
ncbi:MAG TPA: hypothetical protein PKC03_12270 [Dokdonella sp.]|nr:hypothetical protein [Dokdonella sp.]